MREPASRYGNAQPDISDPVCISGANGQDGRDGTSINLLGTYDTLAELQAAHPTANHGDCYMVDGTLYVWSGSSWTNGGNIQGPRGKAIVEISPQYYLSTSKTKCSGGSWTSGGEPTWVSGRYLWMRYAYRYEEETVTHWTTPVLCSTYNKLLAEQLELWWL